MVVKKYPNIKFKTPDWLTANELAGKYIVGNQVKIRTALMENTNLEYIQKKRNGTNVAVCLHCDFVQKFCEITGLQIAEKLPQKTQGWLTSYDLSILGIRGGQHKILCALNQYKDKMPEYIKKMRSGKSIVLCLRYDAVDAFCALSGMKRKNDTSVEKSQAKKEDHVPDTKQYHCPDVFVSMPSLLCSIFGREESR